MSKAVITTKAGNILDFIGKRGFLYCRLIHSIPCNKKIDSECNSDGYKKDWKNSVSYSINSQETLKVNGKVMDVEQYILSYKPYGYNELQDMRHSERNYSVIIEPVVGTIIEFI